jgi:hypothetical protein
LPACHSAVVPETRTYSVSLVSKDPSREVDDFYKYSDEGLPAVGEIIKVRRFPRGHVVRARVTRVDASYDPPITATQID